MLDIIVMVAMGVITIALAVAIILFVKVFNAGATERYELGKKVFEERITFQDTIKRIELENEQELERLASEWEDKFNQIKQEREDIQELYENLMKEHIELANEGTELK